MLKKVFFINHAPKEFHNLLLVFVVSGMLLTSACFFYGTKFVYKTSTVGQTEKTFKIAYELFVEDGYKDTIEDFDSLLKVNSEAVEIAFKLVEKNNVNKSIPSAYRSQKKYPIYQFGYSISDKREDFKYLLGLPFEHYKKVPNWIGRFSAFA